MAIYELDGQAPELPADGNYFIADTATVIGKVRLLQVARASGSARCCAATMSGSRSARGSNVQDNSTCHTDLGFPLTIGKNCTVGHNVILHGCTIEDGALVGMGSIVMNGARIGRGSIVGAGSVITEGKQFPEHSLIIGAPARVIRTLDPAQVAADGRLPRNSTSAQRPALQKGPEEDRLTAALHSFPRNSPRLGLAGDALRGRRPTAHVPRCRPDTDCLRPECSSRAACWPSSNGSGSVRS